jgi:peroxiredoxin
MILFSDEDTIDDYERFSWGNIPRVVPNVIFSTRVYDPTASGPNPYTWADVSAMDIFAEKTVLLFSLPGAFTPTCDTFQLPTFEKMYPEFQSKGIDEIYCISVNDSFVMNKWAESQKLKNVKVLPDGNGDFTREMNMLVDKKNLGFGERSWRYAVVVINGWVKMAFIEPGKEDDCTTDPYFYTKPEFILERL